jgi:hypothetical protein
MKQKTLNLQEKSEDWSWKYWPLVPIYPYRQRKTLRKEILQDTIWTFDQLQGIFYVVIPIRMTVIRLEKGGLLVYAPVAPTPECLRLIGELIDKYGEIKYIILPTSSGLEHKVFVGPFARKFPKAQVFVAPDQWSFPLNLPLSWLGLPPKRTFILPKKSEDTPFYDDFDYAILGPIDLNLGKFVEVAFYHKKTRTLLVTDSVLSIPEDPPPIIQLDSYALLFHAKENAFDQIEDTWENRRKGWQRIALFSVYFQPNVLKIAPWGKVFSDAIQAPDRSKKAFFGLYPFRWENNWQYSFKILRREGNLLVAPILQKLILNRNSTETLDWVYQVSKWNFERIIPCHFEEVIKTNPYQFRLAFTFFEKEFYPPQDLQLLDQINQSLNNLGILPPIK